jgi:SAM-dependent methyltransferase
VCSAAFKNLSDPRGALDDIHRVLRPGARASIHDLRRDANRRRHRVRDSGPAAVMAQHDHHALDLPVVPAQERASLGELAQRCRFGGSEIVSDGVEIELRLTKPSDA